MVELEWVTSKNGAIVSDAMDWKRYEKEITDQFHEHYPSAKITPDPKLIGKFSKITHTEH